MTTPRFDYPNAGAPTSSVLLTWPYDYPFATGYRRIQLQEESDGGQPYVYDKGVEVETFTVKFTQLPQALHDAIVAFFRTVTLMGLYTFDFTDHLGNVTTVRVWQNSVDDQLTAYQRYSLSITLRKENS
jgi:hypothetical protein